VDDARPERVVSTHAHAPRGPSEVAALRQGGRRVTRQRALIWEALLHADGGHVSALEVAASLPDLHQATVYRTLDVLVAEGLARRTELEGRTVYEVAAEHRHHHVICTVCGRVAHVHDEAVEDALGRVAAESGYELADTELAFYGVCAECQE
jgi:Fe2+ or Zn2+ uptake regulation protein